MADFTRPRLAVPLFLAMTFVFIGPARPSPNQHVFKRRRDYDPVFLDKGVLSSSDSIGGQEECVTRCAGDGRCMSVSYATDTGQCRLHDVHFPSSRDTRPPDNGQLWESTVPLCPYKQGYSFRRDLRLCYKIYHDVIKILPDANATCKAEGGHLLIVDSEQKQSFMKDELTHLADRVVTGLGERKGYYVDGRYDQGVWVWSTTNTPMQFSAWCPGESVLRYPAETCTIIDLGCEYGWSSVWGISQRPFICEVTLPESF